MSTPPQGTASGGTRSGGETNRATVNVMPGGIREGELENRPPAIIYETEAIPHEYTRFKQQHNRRSHERRNERSTWSDGKALENLQRKVDELKRESEHLQQGMRAHIRDKEVEIVDLRKHIQELVQNLRSAGEQVAELTSSWERQKQEIHAVKDEFRRAEAQHEITRNQLEEKASELLSVHLFTDQADSFSGADVIGLVNGLNAEILQGAAVVAESLQDSPKDGPKSIPEKQLMDSLREKIGEDLVQALLSRRSADGSDVDLTLVQLALQSCLASCCAHVCRSWILRADDTLLKRVYAGIFDKDKQSAAGRWRCMTRAHTANLDDRRGCLQWMLSWVARLLLLAGFPQQQVDICLRRYEGRMSTILDMAFRIRVAVGENITSMDISLTAKGCGVAYDPSVMEDTYGGKVVNGEHISGTVELGATSRAKTNSGIVEVVMLKPKVVLRSALLNVLGS